MELDLLAWLADTRLVELVFCAGCIFVLRHLNA
jgi:hypothetical protein